MVKFSKCCIVPFALCHFIIFAQALLLRSMLIGSTAEVHPLNVCVMSWPPSKPSPSLASIEVLGELIRQRTGIRMDLGGGQVDFP